MSAQVLDKETTASDICDFETLEVRGVTYPYRLTLARVGGRYDDDRKCWTIPVPSDPYACMELATVVRGLRGCLVRGR